MTVAILRDYMRAELNPFAAADMDVLTDCACSVAGARAGDFATYSEAWATEIMTDPEVREWAAALLPADLLREGELARRPFGLEHGDGPFRCGGCGCSAVGPHITTVDHLNWLRGAMASASDFVWCLECVRAAVG